MAAAAIPSSALNFTYLSPYLSDPAQSTLSETLNRLGTQADALIKDQKHKDVKIEAARSIYCHLEHWTRICDKRPEKTGDLSWNKAWNKMADSNVGQHLAK